MKEYERNLVKDGGSSVLAVASKLPHCLCVLGRNHDAGGTETLSRSALESGEARSACHSDPRLERYCLGRSQTI